MGSLACLSTLASLRRNVATGDADDRPGGTAALANELGDALLLHTDEFGVELPAILALHVVDDVLANDLVHTLRHVVAGEDHLTIVADDAVRTQLGEEEGEDVLGLAVHHRELLREVVPEDLGRRLRHLRLDQLEGGLGVNLLAGRDGVHDHAKHVAVLVAG